MENPAHFCVEINSRPFAGAWIETTQEESSAINSTVAPSRGRGSKHPVRQQVAAIIASPLRGGVDRNGVFKRQTRVYGPIRHLL